MKTPTLCKKHFDQVANYFDKSLALEFALDRESCLICTNVIYVESARRYVEQNKKRDSSQTPRHSIK